MKVRAARRSIGRWYSDDKRPMREDEFRWGVLANVDTATGRSKASGCPFLSLEDRLRSPLPTLATNISEPIR